MAATSVKGPPRPGPLVVPGSSLIHWGTSLVASASACLARVLPDLQMGWDFSHLPDTAESASLMNVSVENHLGEAGTPSSSNLAPAAGAQRASLPPLTPADGTSGTAALPPHRRLLETHSPKHVLAPSLSSSSSSNSSSSTNSAVLTPENGVPSAHISQIAGPSPPVAKETTPLQLHALPFSMSHSYMFFLLTHAFMGLIALTLYGVLMLICRLAGLPSYRVFRLRLRRKGGRHARMLAYVLEQFDDVMIDGALHPSPVAAGTGTRRSFRSGSSFGCRKTAQLLWNNTDVKGLWEGSMDASSHQSNSNATREGSEDSGTDGVVTQRYGSSRFGIATITALGLVGVLNIFCQYFWVNAIKQTAAPLTQVVNAGFIIYLPVLASVMLREPLHGLKLFSSISSFIGVYLCYFSTASQNPSSSLFMDIFVGTAQSLTGALCLALYLVLYKYCNPSGWMLLVIGTQELAASAIGFLLFPLFHIWGKETLGLPQTMQDFGVVARYAGQSLVLNYCMNEAIRWGDPSSISAALVLAPALEAVLGGLLFKTVPLNAGRIMALILTLLGFAIDALYQYGQTLKRRARRSQLKATQLHFYRNQYEEELNDAVDEVGHQTKLLAGNEYII